MNTRNQIQKMKNIFLVSLLLLSIQLRAQQASRLITLEKPIKGFRGAGSSSVHSKSSRGEMTNAMTPRVSMRKSPNGVIIKTDYTASKFDLTGKKVWEIKLPDVFGLNDLPSEQIICDDEYTYFWENGTNPIKKYKASVVQIDPQGKSSENMYELDLKDKAIDFFSLNGNLCVLAGDINKKIDAIEYTLHTIDKADHKLSSKKIKLPTDTYEYEKAKSGKGNHYWNWLGAQDSYAIFYKAYFKDIEGEKKKKKMVIQLLELNDKGDVRNSREVFFEPSLAGDDRKFFAPSILFNPKTNSLIVLGYLEIDKNKVNGLYLLKYDYATASLVDKKEYPFSSLLKQEIKPTIKAHYQIPEQVGAFHSFKISSDDVFFDIANDFLSLRIITDYDMNSSSFFDVKFDKYGDHVQTGISEFPGPVGYLGNVMMQPTKYQLLWKDKTRPHVINSKQGSWDFINSTASGTKEKEQYWIALPYSTQNAAIRFNQELGRFDLIMLK
jgi:hypothetical protein